MKKKFVEPEVVRFELKMTESIAASEQYSNGMGLLNIPVYTRQYVDECYGFYVQTNIVPADPGITDPYILLGQIMEGRCLTNPADEVRALMMLR